MSHFKDLSGQKIGRWTVIEVDKTKKSTYWICKCECGKISSVSRSSLIDGRSTSCGCFRAEDLSKRSKTHGDSHTRLHSIWLMMVQRIENKKSRSYPDYGGRGITLCKEWRRTFKLQVG